MTRFIEGEGRSQVTPFPLCVEDYVGEDNPVRVVDVFVDGLDLRAMGFSGIAPAKTGRLAYHPAALLKLYVYGYLNRIQSSRRLEREATGSRELTVVADRGYFIENPLND
jgi:transposase